MNKVKRIILFFWIMSIGIFAELEPTVTNIIALILLFVLSLDVIYLKKIEINGFTTCYLIFVLVCFGSLFYALDYGLAFGKFRLLLFLSILALLSTSIFKKVEDYLILHYSLIVTAIIMISVMLAENGFMLPERRYEGILGNSNRVGLFISYGLVSLLYNIVYRKRYFFLAFVPLMLIGIFFSGSRKAYVSVLLGAVFIIYFLISKSIRKRKLFSFLIILLILTIGIGVIFNYSEEILNSPMIYNTFVKRWQGFFNFVKGVGMEENSYYRFLFVKIGWNRFLENPIFGHGINNFGILTLKQLPLGLMTYAHNNLIELLFDVGLLGTIPFYCGIGWLVYILVKASRKVRSKEETMNLSFFIYFVISIIINDVALVYYYDRITILIFLAAATFSSSLVLKESV